MAFEWQPFLDRHGVEYTVRKKDLYIHCPFCGGSDSGRHMGVSTAGKGWGCWRAQAHRGKRPERLIAALIGCTWVEAQRIAGSAAGAALAGPGAFMAAVEGALGSSPPADALGPLVKPREFSPCTHGPFRAYLLERGFSPGEVTRLVRRYELHQCWSGDWAYRLIVPVHDEHGDWYTWTGRAISDTAKVRYKTLTTDPDKVKPGAPIARGPITNLLLGLPKLFKGGHMLVVAEGPFDAMRLSLDAGEYDARATCLFGKAISNAQVELLARLRPLYDKVVLLLDPDAALDGMQLQTRTAPLGVHVHLLTGDDDPGEMSPNAVRRLLGGLAKC